MYRIVQEGLTNATVEVIVRDDGRGFDAGQGPPGFGLMGMRERAELVAGTLTVESSPGTGTTIRATLPVRRRGAAAIRSARAG